MGRPSINLEGERYGIMTVMQRDQTVSGGRHISAHWVVQCDCGTVRSISANVLRANKQQSCGCLRGNGARFSKKYFIPKSAYNRWQNMMRRCYSPNSEKDARHYQLRGIVVCDRWHDPELFYLDMGDPPFVGASIDRVNNDGNYEPSNCRWATRSEQNKNRRPFKRIKGEYH